MNISLLHNIFKNSFPHGNEFLHLPAFLSSPTFSAMRGGEEAMVIARKTETKPIKLYITCGTEEPDYYFGSSLQAAQNAASALEFAGYDFRFDLHR